MSTDRSDLVGMVKVAIALSARSTKADLVKPSAYSDPAQSDLAEHIVAYVEQAFEFTRKPVVRQPGYCPQTDHRS